MRYSALRGWLGAVVVGIATIGATGCLPPEPVRSTVSTTVIVTDGMTDEVARSHDRQLASMASTSSPPSSRSQRQVGSRPQPESRISKDSSNRASKRSASRVASSARAPEIREVTLDPRRHGTLPATHRTTPNEPAPMVRSPIDLRKLVGRRDARDSTHAALEWARQLGIVVLVELVEQRPRDATEHATVSELIGWAERRNRLAERDAVPQPGDLLVFERTQSDAAMDLVAVVVGRDARNVVEFVYVANGVIRRGFVDAARAKVHLDDNRQIVNTFLRHGRRWPPRGTRYLSGELLAHVIHTR